MKYETEKILRELLSYLDSADYIRPDSIPNIDLHMDQVTTFMEGQLKSTRRHPDDKIMTKTMINNYAKNDLLPSPKKKKYNKEHMMLLIYIYYLKSFLSINDIDKLLKPLREDYFETEKNGLSTEDIYSTSFEQIKKCFPRFRKDIEEHVKLSEEFRKTLSADKSLSEDSDYLDFLGLITLLSADVYVKKQLIERLIDMMPD